MKFVIRGEGETEAPTELWLEKDAEGGVRLMAQRPGIVGACYLMRFRPGQPISLCTGVPRGLGFATDYIGCVKIA